MVRLVRDPRDGSHYKAKLTRAIKPHRCSFCDATIAGQAEYYRTYHFHSTRLHNYKVCATHVIAPSP
jgi:hypothetical protein